MHLDPCPDPACKAPHQVEARQAVLHGRLLILLLGWQPRVHLPPVDATVQHLRSTGGWAQAGVVSFKPAGAHRMLHWCGLRRVCKAGGHDRRAGGRAGGHPCTSTHQHDVHCAAQVKAWHCSPPAASLCPFCRPGRRTARGLHLAAGADTCSDGQHAQGTPNGGLAHVAVCTARQNGPAALAS